MDTIFNNIEVNYSEYSYFEKLKDHEKVQYLFELFDVSENKGQLNLSGFFETIHDSLFQDETINRDDSDQVDVTVDSENIMIESNSLRAVKFVAYKFVESGYILKRDIAIEKMFKKDKMTRYLRVFNIINNCTGICSN